MYTNDDEWNLRLECIDRAQRIGGRADQTVADAAKIEAYVRNGVTADVADGS